MSAVVSLSSFDEGVDNINHAVHLVTDDDALDELVRDLCMSPLSFGVPRLDIYRKSSIKAERAALDEGQIPQCIILDGSVRAQPTDPEPTDGAPAAEFLRFLRCKETDGKIAKVAILVISHGNLEKVIYEVLQRWDVIIWSPPVPENLEDIQRARVKFTDALIDVLGRHRSMQSRQVVVTVKLRSAHYLIRDRNYTFEIDRFYRLSWQPETLIRLSKEFLSFIDGNPNPGWQTLLQGYGRELYGFILEDVFGTTLINQMKTDKGSLEFRFHLDADDENLEELFLLPFEVANEDLTPENFFCTSIPMARKLQSRSPVGEKKGGRILLVIGATQGVVEISDEITGQKTAEQLDTLALTSDVESFMRRLTLELQAKGSADCSGSALTILGPGSSAASFERELRKQLESGSFDVVHFYGHSVGDSRGTYIIVPGPDPFTGSALSVRAIASWLANSSQIPELVFLSSCQSGSIRSAIEMTKAGVNNVMGFRWKVSEATAVTYVQSFYRSYLLDGNRVSEAFRSACYEAMNRNRGDPIWASAIAIVNDE